MNNPLKKIFRFILRLIIISAATLTIITIVSNLIIIQSARGYLYDTMYDLPHQKVAIVLGTSRFLTDGRPNPYFHNRIMSAAELYHEGKISYIILSGDNRAVNYNEPEQMRREMVKLGIPDSVLYLDYAGLRTLDSMVRSKEIFGQDSIIVVSQKFHNQRAIFLGRSRGIHVVGYNAPDISARQGIRTNTREVFARVKAVYDLVTRKQPRHLGEEIIIGKGRNFSE